MAELERKDDWAPFVDQAVDDFLRTLAEHGPEGWIDAPPEGESLLFRWDPHDEGVEMRAEGAPLRGLLTAYSMQLLAAAGTGAGSLRCNDGRSTVDCQFILRPNGTPYYRCLHAPPDCYDSSFRKIGCP